MKSLDNYLKAPSPQDLIELSKNQLNKVDQEIEKLIQIRSILNRIVFQSEEALNAPLDKVILMDFEEEPILYSDKNTLKSDTTNEEWSSYYEEFFKKTELKDLHLLALLLIKMICFQVGLVESIGYLFVWINQMLP